jgi:cell shape-determining protein MreC
MNKLARWLLTVLSAPLIVALYKIFEISFLKTMSSWPSNQIPSYILLSMMILIGILIGAFLHFLSKSISQNHSIKELQKENTELKELNKQIKILEDENKKFKNEMSYNLPDDFDLSKATPDDLIKIIKNKY